jgi:hypothetical protein
MPLDGTNYSPDPEPINGVLFAINGAVNAWLKANALPIGTPCRVTGGLAGQPFAIEVDHAEVASNLAPGQGG